MGREFWTETKLLGYVEVIVKDNAETHMKEAVFDFQGCPCSGKNLSRLLQPAIMALLLREPLHGYRVLELLKEEAMFKEQPPDQTGVYRILRNMEQEKLVACDWELQDSGPARRQYALTEKGLSCLQEWKQTLIDYHDSVSSIIALLNRALGPF